MEGVEGDGGQREAGGDGGSEGGRGRRGEGVKEVVEGGCHRFEDSLSLAVCSRALIRGDEVAGYIPTPASLTPVTSDCARLTLLPKSMCRTIRQRPQHDPAVKLLLMTSRGVNSLLNLVAQLFDVPRNATAIPFALFYLSRQNLSKTIWKYTNLLKS